MAKRDPAEWEVREHGPIEPIAENLWRVTGSLPGMSLRRVMVVVRLSDGRLLLHSAIAMREPQMKELEALGPIAFLIVPNRAHRLDAPRYRRRYPDARVLCPRAARAKVAEVVPVDGTYEDFPSDPTARFEPLHGTGDEEGVLLVTSGDGTSVVLNDAVMNMDRKRDPLGFFFTTLLGSAPGPRVSRLAKLVFVKDKRALRADLERLAALPDLRRLFVAHEKVAEGPDARAALLRAATYL